MDLFHFYYTKDRPGRYMTTSQDVDYRPILSARGDTILFMLIDGRVGSPLMKFKPFMSKCVSEVACVCSVWFCAIAACKLSNWPFHTPQRTAPPAASSLLFPPSPLSSIILFDSPRHFRSSCPLVSPCHFYPSLFMHSSGIICKMSGTTDLIWTGMISLHTDQVQM